MNLILKLEKKEGVLFLHFIDLKYFFMNKLFFTMKEKLLKY